MNLEFLFNALATVWLVGEILIVVLTQTRRSEGKIQDRGTQIVLWVVIVLSFRIDQWMHRLFPVDMPGSHSWLRPAALVILLLGLGIAFMLKRLRSAWLLEPITKTIAEALSG